ncbi:Probable ABC transporter ATP-binding protein HI_0664 [uncultured Blautia sp.]|nr:ABC transporter ATP-binding protein [uncultured Blautia sp.]SCH48319.1 Probable ABC transporter ATP-binding protein HI_0664 [uncultured Blautia sp.]
MSDKNNNAREMTETQKNIYRQKIDMAMAGTDTTKKRRSAIAIMGSLIGLVKPLLHIMAAAIILGTVGYLCAIFLTILAGQVILRGLAGNAAGAGISVISEAAMKSTWLSGASVNRILAVMILMAVLRGILHYMEQYCNHFIAFKLLAIIRHKVFAALRKLCPAKLEGRDKGNLISIITTDIELLEVFYAHTISPIAIATLTSVIMVIFIGRYHVLAGVLALASYLIVGVVIPMWNGKRGSQKGMEFRTEFGELNSFVLDSLRGMDETIQYDQGKKRKGQMSDRSRKLAGMQEDLSWMEGFQRSFTNLMILLASFGMLALTIYLYGKGEIGFDGILTCTIAMMGSFGPVVALSSLSNNLNQTLASGERVLSLLEEKPLVEEILDGTEFHAVGRFNDMEKQDEPERITAGMYVKGSDSEKIENESVVEFTGAEVSHVTFAYEEETILDDYSLKLAPGKITGIHGSSGSGKSTLLKLLMRFWDVNEGMISVDNKDVREISTRHLRDLESYVTQETHLFHDSIANNIAIAKPGATREEIMAAAKKASINDFIMTLPKGYDTEVGELGDTLSGGEKQRIGIARAFLHDSPLLLLDEPTSNLDSLNEGIILKSLKEDKANRTVVLVSHRTSTMKVADVVYEMENGRVS